MIENKDDRLVFILHDLEERKIPDIMKVMDITQDMARGRLARGREAFFAAANRLDPHQRETLRARNFRCIPFFPPDLAALVEAGRHLDDGPPAVQAAIWDRLQEHMPTVSTAAVGPPFDDAVSMGMGRHAVTTGQLVGGGVIVFLVGCIVTDALHRLHPTPTAELAIAADIGPVLAAVSPVDSAASASPIASVSTPLPSTTPAPTSSSSSATKAPETDQELLDLASGALEANPPRLNMAIAALQRHAKSYPKSPRSKHRNTMLIQALRLAKRNDEAAALAKQHGNDVFQRSIDSAATATANPQPRARP
jgi:hypothetical protein